MGEINQYLRTLAMQKEALTSKEIANLIKDVQSLAFQAKLPDVGARQYQSAIDDLCRMVIWLCNESTDSGEQRYLTDKLMALTGALDI